MNFPRPSDTIHAFWRHTPALCPKCKATLVAYFPKLSKHPAQMHCDLCGYHVEKPTPKKKPHHHGDLQTFMPKRS